MFFKKTNNAISFYLLAFLFALLPFHAFFVTFLNQLFFDGATSAPLFLRMWKEGIIFLLFILLAWQFFFQKQKLLFNKLDYAILAYFLLGFFSALFITQDLKIAIYGAKYDFVFLAFYLIVRQLPFTEKQLQTIFKIVLGGAMILIVFGILQKLILPENFLTYFGYSPEHSHFSPNKPLAYCQKVSGTETCRVQSFLSGPNQFGSYLLVILPLFFISFWQKSLSAQSPLPALRNFSVGGKRGIQWVLKKAKSILSFPSFLSFPRIAGESPSPFSSPNFILFKNTTFFLLDILTLIFTYSRASWLGFAGMCFVGVILLIKNKKTLWKVLAGFLIAGILSLLILQFSAPDFFHKIVFRPSSTQGHGERMEDGVKFSLENPLGLGLGNAGPASNHFAKDYLGFVPESWYLQVSLELGILGIIIYLTILGLALRTLYKKYKKEKDFYALALLLSLSGIMIASFFLHTWEDSSTALIFWGMVGVVLGKSK